MKKGHKKLAVQLYLHRFVNGRNVKIEWMTKKTSSEILGDEIEVCYSKFLSND